MALILGDPRGDDRILFLSPIPRRVLTLRLPLPLDGVTLMTLSESRA